MSEPRPRVTLVRHGETPWSLSGQHTGRQDLPLTPRGEEEARRLGARLRGRRFDAVYTSPLQRARRSCELAGFGGAAVELPDLMEWDYGSYEGLRVAEIRATRPDWSLFEHGGPGGEALEDVVRRADRVLALLRSRPAEILVFAHGHLNRVLAMRWAGLPPVIGRRFSIASGSMSILGHDSSGDPAIECWNDTAHLEE